MKRFSPEIIDIILQNLSLEQLPNCSLVCHSWRPTSQRLFFRHTWIAFERCDEYLEDREDYRNGPVWDHVPTSRRLYQVLCDSPHLASYIKHLVVYTTDLSVDETLHLVFTKLRNLKHLAFDLYDHHWADLDPGLRQACCQGLQLPSVTFAEVYGKFNNMNELESLLYYPQNLCRLDLWIVFESSLKNPMLENGMGHEFERLAPHYPTHLELSISNYSIFLDWFLGSRSLFKVSRIHTLKIEYPWQGPGGDYIHRLLRDIGPELQNLSINSYQLDDPCQETIVLFNSKTKCLEFKEVCLSNISADQLYWLLHLIPAINASNQLRKVTFDVWVYKDSDIKVVNWPAWETVDRFLAGSHFKCLQQLDVTLHVADSCVETPDNMVAMFPLLSVNEVAVHGAVILNKDWDYTFRCEWHVPVDIL